MELLRRLLRWLNGRPDKVMYIGGSDTLPPPLPRQEEAEWIARLERGELLARQTLIERNLRLVVYIARRFENTGINIEDLISIGTIGLIKAINTFRADKNIKLATYASRCIENEILMYLRKNSAHARRSALTSPEHRLGRQGAAAVRRAGHRRRRGHGAHRGRRGPQAPGGGSIPAVSPGEGHHLPAVWPGRPEGADPEGGSRPHGHLPVVHLPPGKRIISRLRREMQKLS